ncbi:ATP-binding domain-containing protein [Chitinivibrio alkaliphilus]|nr:ATP-binding domain-containing protein [Chitinivibrio alkaliphilus]
MKSDNISEQTLTRDVTKLATKFTPSMKEQAVQDIETSTRDMMAAYKYQKQMSDLAYELRDIATNKYPFTSLLKHVSSIIFEDDESIEEFKKEDRSKFKYINNTIDKIKKSHFDYDSVNWEDISKNLNGADDFISQLILEEPGIILLYLVYISKAAYAEEYASNSEPANELVNPIQKDIEDSQINKFKDKITDSWYDAFNRHSKKVNKDKFKSGFKRSFSGVLDIHIRSYLKNLISNVYNEVGGIQSREQLEDRIDNMKGTGARLSKSNNFITLLNDVGGVILNPGKNEKHAVKESVIDKASSYQNPYQLKVDSHMKHETPDLIIEELDHFDCEQIRSGKAVIDEPFKRAIFTRESDGDYNYFFLNPKLKQIRTTVDVIVEAGMIVHKNNVTTSTIPDWYDVENERNAIYTSYYSSAGRVAECEPGDSYVVGNGICGSVLQVNDFVPIRTGAKRDGIKVDVTFEKGKEIEGMHFKSLRKLKQNLVGFGKDLLRNQKGLSSVETTGPIAEEATEKISQGHWIDKLFEISSDEIPTVSKTMSLKEQMFLDKIQGDFFRQPLGKHLIMEGAPGTGKTTTIIKRLKQKTIWAPEDDILTKEELKIINRISGGNPEEVIHGSNWYFFSPSPLLEQYLKESIGAEGLSATQDTVKVWSDRRIPFSKSIGVFPKSLFSQEKKNKILAKTDSASLVKLAKKFTEHIPKSIEKRVEETRKQLEKAGAPDNLIELLRESEGSIGRVVNFEKMFDIVSELIDHKNDYLRSSKNGKREIDERVSKILFAKIDEGHRFFELLFPLCRDLTIEDDDNEDITGDQESMIKARGLLSNTIRFIALKLANASQNEPSTSIIECSQLLKQYNLIPNQDMLVDYGKLLNQITLLTEVASHKILVDNIPLYYKEFRKNRMQIEKHLFSDLEYIEKNPNKISGLEIDIIVHRMLQNTNYLVKRYNSIRIPQSSPSVKRICEKYRLQVAVDEATDFSALQLSIFSLLAHPLCPTVSLVGDVMQRITHTGLTDWSDTAWDDSRFERSEIVKVYRQQPKLLEIASFLYEQETGNPPAFKSGKLKKWENRQAPDALLYRTDSETKTIDWVCERLVELQNVYGGEELPSIGVIAPNDNMVEDIVDALEESEFLADNQIETVGCTGDGVLNAAGKVAVVSIEHVKGLEFNAVFFWGIDQLEEKKLLNRYLYVGLTRATEFLAVTCRNKMPVALKRVGHFFKDGRETNWSDFSFRK